MAKFDSIKMAELVKVEEGEEHMVLIFQGDVRVTIRMADGTLASEVS